MRFGGLPGREKIREEKEEGKEVMQGGDRLNSYNVTAPPFHTHTHAPKEVKYSSPNYTYSLSILFNLSVPQFHPLYNNGNIAYHFGKPTDILVGVNC